MNIENKDIKEFLNFLNFSFKFYKKTNTLFYISDKKYFINIIVDNEGILEINTFVKKKIDICTNNYNLYFDITEKLLVKLYKNGVSIKDLIIYLKRGDIISNNFGFFKFYSFIKNFDFSSEKWDLFIKSC